MKFPSPFPLSLSLMLILRVQWCGKAREGFYACSWCRLVFYLCFFALVCYEYNVYLVFIYSFVLRSHTKHEFALLKKNNNKNEILLDWLVGKLFFGFININSKINLFYKNDIFYIHKILCFYLNLEMIID